MVNFYKRFAKVLLEGSDLKLCSLTFIEITNSVEIMKTDKMKQDKNHFQEGPEDAEKNNAQQERDYRKQKDGTMKKSPKDTPDEKATKKFTNLKSEQKKKDDEKE